MLSPFENTFIISATRTSCTNLIFGSCFSLLSITLLKTVFSFGFQEASVGVVFDELWIVSLYCLMTDGNSVNQSAFPLSNLGFFIKLRKVLFNRSAVDGPLSVNLDYCLMLYIVCFQEVLNYIVIKFCSSILDSNLTGE